MSRTEASERRPSAGAISARCRVLARSAVTAVRFSFSLQLHEGAEDTGTTFCSPWPGLSRPPTSWNVALGTAGKTWMAGTSPAKGISLVWAPRGSARALSGRHVREEPAQALGHCRVREDRVAQSRVGHACQHRGLHHGHDFTSLRAKHRETEDVVAVGCDQRL